MELRGPVAHSANITSIPGQRSTEASENRIEMIFRPKVLDICGLSWLLMPRVSIRILLIVVSGTPLSWAVVFRAPNLAFHVLQQSGCATAKTGHDLGFGQVCASMSPFVIQKFPIGPCPNLLKGDLK